MVVPFLLMLLFETILGVLMLYYQGKYRAEAKRYLKTWNDLQTALELLERRTAICALVQEALDETTGALHERDQRLGALEDKQAVQKAGR